MTLLKRAQISASRGSAQSWIAWFMCLPLISSAMKSAPPSRSTFSSSGGFADDHSCW